MTKPTPEPSPSEHGVADSSLPPLPNRSAQSQWGVEGAHVSNQPIYIVARQGSLIGRWLGWLGWLVAAGCLLYALSLYNTSQDYFNNSGGISEKYHSLSRTAKSKIAVLDASGVIMSGQGFVKQQIDRIRKDKSIKGIVLRIDSPGGTVYGSDYMYHHLVKLRQERDHIPMVVSMGSVAASGGYYIAMAVGDQEKCIYAEPMTTTGSIGVILPHYNVAGLMKEFGVVDDSIATHPRKGMLSISKEMSEDHREVITKYIDHAFTRFKNVIKEGRPKFAEDPATLDVLATGEVFTAKQAKESGLIDEVGFIEDAIERVIEMAGLNTKTTRVVTYSKPVSLVDALALGKSSDQQVLKEMLELTKLQAYYLAAPIPSILTAKQD